ncbi:uncharacterized protein CPUR_04611 [Claviceps purpurea 20.1]|uniref:Uncharacterized protein n=1 Tax=Claviceps purpurea (strain 20.1) TaxID=1111077 RepID=M1VW71_CLAP2|nr:uncharacterized protein CPUR_04611 [Claviceps purpurea 20.1]
MISYYQSSPSIELYNKAVLHIAQRWRHTSCRQHQIQMADSGSAQFEHQTRKMAQKMEES